MTWATKAAIDIAALNEEIGFLGIYLVLNPVKKELLERSPYGRAGALPGWRTQPLGSD
jgi:hypothetical protein